MGGPSRDEGAEADEGAQRLTARDALVGAAHGVQLAKLGSPGVQLAAQSIGVLDAAKVASDVASGEPVRPIDAASAAASVTLASGLASPAVQAGATVVAGIGALEAGQRALNTFDDEQVRQAAAKPFNTRIQDRSAELHHYADHSMSREQARIAVREDLQALATMGGRSRQAALGTIGRIAESQQTYREHLQQADPGVASVALAEARRQRDRIAQSQAEYRASPEGIASAPQAARLHIEVALAEAQHDQWRAGRSYAAIRPLAAEPGASASKDDRKQAEYERLQNEGANDIAARHAALQGPGVSIEKLSALQTERIAREDCHALAALVGHPLEAEAAAFVQEHLKHGPYRKAFEQAQEEINLTDGVTAEGALLGAVRRRALHAASIEGGMSGVQDHEARQHAAMDAADLRKLTHPERRDEALAVIGANMHQNPAYKQAFEQAERNAESRGAAAPVKEVSPLRDTPREAQDTALANTLRSVGDTAAKRPAHPPLEDRFNIVKTGLLEKQYHFRDQAGKVAFTEKMFSFHTSTDSPAAIKAMVDRAAERGWQTVSLKGSPEFVRQGWIAANAHGLKAVGHTPTQADRDAATKERARLEAGRNAAGSRQQQEVTAGAQLERVERADRARAAPGPIEQRQLAAAIEKALVDGKVAPEIREQVRDMMAAEGARRMARGERYRVPVYDARAPRARAKTITADPQRLGDRERSR